MSVILFLRISLSKILFDAITSLSPGDKGQTVAVNLVSGSDGGRVLFCGRVPGLAIYFFPVPQFRRRIRARSALAAFSSDSFEDENLNISRRGTGK